MVYLTLTAMLMLVLLPLLVPAVIHGSHAVANSLRKSPLFRKTNRRQMLANSRAA
jgi:ABC-type transport system involved in cytochrome c biogenesis permease component